jgi:hypothetical protein
VFQKAISMQDVTFSVSLPLFYLIRDYPSVMLREDIKKAMN